MGLSQLHIPDCGIVKLTQVYSSFFLVFLLLKLIFFLISSFYVRLLGLELCYFFRFSLCEVIPGRGLMKLT